MSQAITSLRGTTTHHPLANSFHEKPIPIDVWKVICSYLNAPQRKALALANTHLYAQIFSDSISWESFSEKYFPASFAHPQSGFALYKHLATVEHHIEHEKYRLQILNGHRDWVSFILAKENWLISSCDDTQMKVWDLKTGKELFTLEGHEDMIDNFIIHKERLISSSYDLKMKIWDLKKGKPIHTFQGHDGIINGFLFNDDKLISASEDYTIKIWDLNQGTLEYTLKGHQGGIKSILLHGENQLISCSGDAMIKIWDLENRKEVHTFTGHQHEITDIAIYGKLLISSSVDSARIWDLESREQVHAFEEYQYLKSNFLVYENQLILASGERDNILKIWDLEKGESRYDIDVERPIKRMYLHEHLLIYGLNSHNFGIWDLKKEEAVGTIETHLPDIRCIDTYRNMFAASFQNTIKIWDLRSQKLMRTLTGHQGRINDIIWHEDRLISASDDKTIRIWDFSFPSRSLYSRELLDENFAILKEMSDAVCLQQHEVAMRLSEKLDPDFRDRLRQHRFKVGTSFASSMEVISRVQSEVYVELLLDGVHREDLKRISQILPLLIEIDYRNLQIYDLLEIVCKESAEGWGEHAFHNEKGYSASIFQKEEAILAFKECLKERWGEDLPLLLADFGIITEKEYSKKLSCSFYFLQKIGILSPADLQALGLCLSNLSHLKVDQEKGTRDYRQILQTLSEQLNQKFIETANCTVRLYRENNPWVVFQQQLNHYQTTFAFSEDHVKIVREINVLIDDFNSLDEEHQALKLRAYVTQAGLVEAWVILHQKRIDSLAELLGRPEIAPRDLFHMGK